MVSEMLDRAAAAPRLQSAAMRLRALWWTAPLLLVAVYLVTLMFKMSNLIGGAYLNADSASAPVIGELFEERGRHALVILGHLGWFSTLLFEIATRWLPMHRQIWEGSPYAMALLSAGLVGWGMLRVAGRWAAAIAVTIIVCASPAALSLLLVLDDHAPTWYTLAGLAAFILLLELRVSTLSRPVLTALVIAVGVLLGVNAVSDVLLLIAGAAPFLIAVCAVWFLCPSSSTRMTAGLAAAASLVALISGIAIHVVMRHENVIVASDVKTKLFVSADAMSNNFKLWWQSIAVLGNGDFFGLAMGFSSALALLCALLAVAAVFFSLRIAWREAARAFAHHRELGFEQHAIRPEQRSARLAWVIYWVTSLVLLSAGFIFSDTPEDIGSSRYLLGAIYAVAALVPLAGAHSSRLRAAITVGATLFAFNGWLALAQDRLTPPPSPSYGLASDVARIAKKEHLTVGYGDYWDAAPITWATHMRVRVFPVDDCAGNQHLCAFELHLITSWYSPRHGVKTFLLADPAWPAVSAAPTPDLGKPVAVHQIGAVMMYVYPYDIASRLFAL